MKNYSRVKKKDSCSSSRTRNERPQSHFTNDWFNSIGIELFLLTFFVSNCLSIQLQITQKKKLLLFYRFVCQRDSQRYKEMMMIVSRLLYLMMNVSLSLCLWKSSLHHSNSIYEFISSARLHKIFYLERFTSETFTLEWHSISMMARQSCSFFSFLFPVLDCCCDFQFRCLSVFIFSVLSLIPKRKTFIFYISR
jgi:hypothetical protein